MNNKIEDFNELIKQSYFLKINELVLTTNDGDNLTLDLEKIGKAEFQYKYLKNFIENIVSRKSIFYSDLDENSKKKVMDEYLRISQNLELEKSALKQKMNKLMEISLKL